MGEGHEQAKERTPPWFSQQEHLSDRSLLNPGPSRGQNGKAQLSELSREHGKRGADEAFRSPDLSIYMGSNLLNASWAKED